MPSINAAGRYPGRSWRAPPPSGVSQCAKAWNGWLPGAWWRSRGRSGRAWWSSRAAQRWRLPLQSACLPRSAPCWPRPPHTAGTSAPPVRRPFSTTCEKVHREGKKRLPSDRFDQTTRNNSGAVGWRRPETGLPEGSIPFWGSFLAWEWDQVLTMVVCEKEKAGLFRGNRAISGQKMGFLANKAHFW
jgi:hypothetical protein